MATMLSLCLTIASAQWSVIPNGTYILASCCNPGYVMDYNAGQTANGTNIHCWEKNGSAAQSWYISGNGIYPTKNILTAVDNNGSNVWNGNNIHVWAVNHTDAQSWLFKHHGGDIYSIHLASNPNYVIDLNGSNTYNGNNIHLWEYNGTNAQKWHIIRLAPSGSGGGSYYVAPPVYDNNNQCGTCSATGRCQICGGSGWSPNHAPGILAKCGGCGGSGRCSSCNGLGRH